MLPSPQRRRESVVRRELEEEGTLELNFYFVIKSQNCPYGVARER